MKLIASLFSKLTPDPIAKLRTIAAANARELKAVDDLTAEYQRVQEAEHAARNRVESDPTAENVRNATELAAALPATLRAIGTTSARAAITARINCAARTLEALRHALPTVRARLEQERDEILKLERQISARVGTDEIRESAALVRLNEEIRRCDAYANTLATCTGRSEDFDAITKIQRFALGQ